MKWFCSQCNKKSKFVAVQLIALSLKFHHKWKRNIITYPIQMIDLCSNCFWRKYHVRRYQTRNCKIQIRLKHVDVTNIPKRNKMENEFANYKKELSLKKKRWGGKANITEFSDSNSSSNSISKMLFDLSSSPLIISSSISCTETSPLSNTTPSSNSYFRSYSKKKKKNLQTKENHNIKNQMKLKKKRRGMSSKKNFNPYIDNRFKKKKKNQILFRCHKKKYTKNNWYNRKGKLKKRKIQKPFLHTQFTKKKPINTIPFKTKLENKIPKDFEGLFFKKKNQNLIQEKITDQEKKNLNSIRIQKIQEKKPKEHFIKKNENVINYLENILNNIFEYEHTINKLILNLQNQSNNISQIKKNIFQEIYNLFHQNCLNYGKHPFSLDQDQKIIKKKTLNPENQLLINDTNTLPNPDFEKITDTFDGINDLSFQLFNDVANIMSNFHIKRYKIETELYMNFLNHFK
ncbi:hypothetical protein M0813_14728 [Anaeramoeba flamelloides]|uniref:Uncharacterized protein n=1 Tax=Anaeramoeba flamelloides TaxID=1746091 RepID=A0ABQ8Z5J4_9EUKA|nr:hypothetical protein M0813_14728 [Anaeramoeba flamelloides]